MSVIYANRQQRTGPTPHDHWAQALPALAQIFTSMQQQQAANKLAQQTAQHEAGVAQQTAKINHGQAQEMVRNIDPTFMNAGETATVNAYGRAQGDAVKALGNANVRPEKVAAKQEVADNMAPIVRAGLEKAAARQHKVDEFRAMRTAAMAAYDEETRKVMGSQFAAIEGMMRGGVEDQAIDGIIQATMPDLHRVTQTRKAAMEIANMENQVQADDAATGILLQSLVDMGYPELAPLTQIEGLRIWGAGKSLVDLFANERNSALFLRNTITNRNMERDNIEARNEGDRARQAVSALGGIQNIYAGVVRSVLDHPITEAGPNGEPVQRRITDLNEARNVALERMRTIYGGAFPKEFEAQILNMDGQVLSDFYGLQQTASQYSAAELAAHLRAQGRTPAQIAETVKMLQQSQGANFLGVLNPRPAQQPRRGPSR